MTLAGAQLSYRGEVELASDITLTSSGDVLSPTFGLNLRTHLELDYSLAPLDFRVVLDPTLRIAGTSTDTSFIEPGLTEAYALYRLEAIDISAGLERLPLEKSRLSVPYRLEPLGKTGQPLGLLGVRASIFLDSWRIRPAFIYRSQDEQLGGVLSVRRDFRNFDLEGQLVYLNSLAAGLGGSGLLGEVIIYGEAWLLTDPLNIRTALGLSGFWGDLLWTLEAAYAPNPLGGKDAYPQLLFQGSLPQGESGSWELSGGVGLVDSVFVDSSTFLANASLSYTFSETDYSLRVGPSFSYTELATLYGFRLSITSYF